MELGVAYMWLGRYQEAWRHFHEQIDESPLAGDGFYGMAGVAQWCLGDPEKAVAEWRAGLQARYARAAGLPVRMPMLLFFASTIYPALISRAEVDKLLLKATLDRRIKVWPAPIAKRLLGQIESSDLQSLCQGKRPKLTMLRHWLTAFYESVITYDCREHTDFRRAMMDCANTEKEELLERSHFLSILWNEEFFLARHEASRRDDVSAWSTTA